MRIGLVTTWQERCGIAEYGANLVNSVLSVDKDVSVTIICRPFSFDHVVNEARSCDLVVFNYEPGLFHAWKTQDVLNLRALTGVKVVLILHTSHDGVNATDFTEAFDMVVVHEHTADTSPKFRFIPMGIPVVSDLHSQSLSTPFSIATVGFPFAWKGFTNVARAAEMLAVSCTIYAPESPHIDTHITKQSVVGIDSVTYRTDWIAQDPLVRELSKHNVIVFAYDGHNYGQSAAITLGLAAKRPVVVSNSRQFRSWHEYIGEGITLIPATSPVAIADGIVRASHGSLPSVPYKLRNWTSVGGKYLNLFQSLVGVRVAQLDI